MRHESDTLEIRIFPEMVVRGAFAVLRYVFLYDMVVFGAAEVEREDTWDEIAHSREGFV